METSGSHPLDCQGEILATMSSPTSDPRLTDIGHYLNLGRRELQRLCKAHGIKANLPNHVMANELLNVEKGKSTPRRFLKKPDRVGQIHDGCGGLGKILEFGSMQAENQADDALTQNAPCPVSQSVPKAGDALATLPEGSCPDQFVESETLSGPKIECLNSNVREQEPEAMASEQHPGKHGVMEAISSSTSLNLAFVLNNQAANGQKDMDRGKTDSATEMANLEDSARDESMHNASADAQDRCQKDLPEDSSAHFSTDNAMETSVQESNRQPTPPPASLPSDKVLPKTLADAAIHSQMADFTVTGKVEIGSTFATEGHDIISTNGRSLTTCSRGGPCGEGAKQILCTNTDGAVAGPCAEMNESADKPDTALLDLSAEEIGEPSSVCGAVGSNLSLVGGADSAIAAVPAKNLSQTDGAAGEAQRAVENKMPPSKTDDNVCKGVSAPGQHQDKNDKTPQSQASQQNNVTSSKAGAHQQEKSISALAILEAEDKKQSTDERYGKFLQHRKPLKTSVFRNVEMTMARAETRTKEQKNARDALILLKRLKQ